MIYKKSSLPEDQRLGWLDEQARLRIEADKQARLEWLKQNAETIKAKAAEIAKVEAGKQAYKTIASHVKGDVREVVVVRAKENAMRLSGHIGETALPDTLDHLRRLSADLGIAPGSLGLEDSLKWGNLAVHFTGADRIAGQNMKRSVVIAVETACGRGPRKLGKQEVAKAPDMTREEYRAYLRSGSQVQMALAVKALQQGRVAA